MELVEKFQLVTQEIDSRAGNIIPKSEMGYSPAPELKTRWEPLVNNRAYLPEVEPALLATLFTAACAQSLLRLEVALGTRLLRELRNHESYRRTWLRLLAAEAGLRLAGLTCGGRFAESPNGKEAMLIPPLAALKALLRLSRASRSLEGGWRCGSPKELSSASAALWHLDVSNTDGRELLDPDSGRSWGYIRRAALVHFDLHGCFGTPDWDALVDGFETGEGVMPGAPRTVRSNEVVIDIEGIRIPIALQVSATSIPQGPEGGIFVHMNLKGLDAYFQEDSIARRSRHQRQDDYLHVACLLRCGHDVERKESCLFAYDKNARLRSPHGDYMREYLVFWWFDTVAQGVGHLLTLQVIPGNTTTPSASSTATASGSRALEAFETTELGNAQWNLTMAQGTEFAELATDPENEYAASAFPPGRFEGKIALIRRGGGYGFAHKALAARDAGAIGCVVYEMQGDRESMGGVQFMGRTFEGREYPDPGIPSVLVSAEIGRRLLAGVASPGGVQTRINIDRSIESLRQLAPDFKAFHAATKRGEPAHMAVLVERASKSEAPALSTPPHKASLPRLAWFDSLASMPPRFSPLLSRRPPQGTGNNTTLQL